jgi:hypothetical protein
VTARVIPIRPRIRPGSSRAPSPSRPGVSRPVPVRPAVAVEWDGVRGVYIAVCHRCCESLTTERFDQAHDWADTHTCDPELAALLTDITRVRRAA